MVPAFQIIMCFMLWVIYFYRINLYRINFLLRKLMFEAENTLNRKIKYQIHMSVWKKEKNNDKK